MIIGWHGRETYSTNDTILLGEELAKFVQSGDVFALEGDLASGKTTFMKGVARGLGFNGEVTSPTFTMVNEYEGNPKIIHIDCYRENNIKRWIQLGINEYFDENNVVFIEWAELIKPLLPTNIILIKFVNICENTHRIDLVKINEVTK